MSPRLPSIHFSLIIAILLLSGCSQKANTNSLSHFYDYQLYNSTLTPLSLPEWQQTFTDADVILIGEWHTHAGIHHFQADFLHSLIQNKAHIALSMEQFSRDAQPILNQYLANQIGEQTLIQQAKGWPNYESDYRPVVELAKANQLDVIAANAPKSIVQCIAKDGLGYLDKLDPEQRQYAANHVDTRDSEYKQKFMASMHHGEPSKHENLYASQLTWDATMAESIVNYRSHHPDTTVVHIAGKFHTEGGLGIANQIKQLNPNLKVMIITPVFELAPQGNDYLLQVSALPKRYVQQSNQFAAYKQLAKRKEGYECQ